MSESDSAELQQGGDAEEEDCPLCFEPLPPFWDTGRRASAICCGKSICKNCMNQLDAYLDNARASGTYGRQEQQLGGTCSLCRTPYATRDNEGRTMMESYEQGQLPLSLYSNLAAHFRSGQGGLERDVERGNELLRLGAGRGDPNCQLNIGGKYRQGVDGLPKSRSDAKRWWLAAAEQGHAIAEYNLAVMEEEEGNDAEYLRYMKGSASKGFDRACSSLGRAHYYGKHELQRSFEEAIRVLTPAAERGHAESMSLLGAMMCQPDPQLPPPSPENNLNFTKGVHWLRRAAEKGDETAISNVREIEEGASKFCFRCKKRAPPERTFLRCSKCRAAWYCSKDCQRRHWKAAEAGHKQCCIKWDEGS